MQGPASAELLVAAVAAAADDEATEPGLWTAVLPLQPRV